MILLLQAVRTRREALVAGGLLPALLLSLPSAAGAVVTPAKIDLSRAPSHPFDAGDARLREAATLFQKALDARTVLIFSSIYVSPAAASK